MKLMKIFQPFDKQSVFALCKIFKAKHSIFLFVEKLILKDPAFEIYLVIASLLAKQFSVENRDRLVFQMSITGAAYVLYLN